MFAFLGSSLVLDTPPGDREHSLLTFPVRSGSLILLIEQANDSLPGGFRERGNVAVEFLLRRSLFIAGGILGEGIFSTRLALIWRVVSL
jgi:hypothetical protein